MCRTVLMCVLAAALLVQPAWSADKPDLPVFSPKVKTIAAFKNGLGFVFKSCETELKAGEAVLDELPAAALGTLWIGTTPPGRVTGVVSYKRTILKPAEALNLVELLESNLGQKVAVTYTQGGSAEPKRMEGTVISVPKNRKPEDIGPPPNPNSGRYYDPSDLTRAQIVIIRDDTGKHIAINRNALTSVELLQGKLETSLEREVNSAKIKVGTGANKGVEALPKSAEVTVAYLEKGINWSPSYLVNIKNEKQADITLEAILANDVEDLQDVDVSFVVGYPSFMYSDMVTPLAVRQNVAAFVQGLMLGGAVSGRTSNYSAATQQSMDYRYTDGASSWNPESAYSTTKPMPGETNEDLYFYSQPHVTLAKGERARYTVFTASVPYEHIYQWDLPNSDNLDDRGYRRDSNRDTKDEPTDQVWHALRVENTTAQPWTTAPAFVTNGAMPVAQNLLTYTPPKAKSTVKLTVATDVRAEEKQTEESREIVKLGYNEYDRVQVKGVLTVRNFKAKAIRIIVKKSLTGEVTESGAGGKVTKVAWKLAAVNSNSEVEWEFDLKPGEEKQLDYTYKILLRR